VPSETSVPGETQTCYAGNLLRSSPSVAKLLRLMYLRARLSAAIHHGGFWDCACCANFPGGTPASAFAEALLDKTASSSNPRHSVSFEACKSFHYTKSRREEVLP